MQSFAFPRSIILSRAGNKQTSLHCLISISRLGNKVYSMEFNPGVAPHISCIAVNSEICLLATRLNNVLDATFVKEWYLLYKLKH